MFSGTTVNFVMVGFMLYRVNFAPFWNKLNLNRGRNNAFIVYLVAKSIFFCTVDFPPKSITLYTVESKSLNKKKISFLILNHLTNRCTTLKHDQPQQKMGKKLNRLIFFPLFNFQKGTVRMTEKQLDCARCLI